MQDTIIKKVLIANRGEIVCRILRSLRNMGISGVVVYHPIDADSPAVQMADETVEIDGDTPVAAYLSVENIISACQKTGADAVHPGFGFLAENAEFAKRLAEEEILFIGPSPESIELMGDKIKARSFCLSNGFPLAPAISGDEGEESFLDQARQIGVPLLIKAAAGGGGKGMHIVREIEDLEQAIGIARGEALRFFGNDAVYAERYVEQPRHIEVQVLGDNYGKVIHLGERECSIQRRFQKIIEETPAPGLSNELRENICATAVEIAEKTGYQNAGTVEFLLAPNDEFYFLEMNTRIQVEHPVTEMVTGIDIVEMQIRIAQGEAINFSQTDVCSKGHAIELRLYAEDSENDFLPATGTLLVYDMPGGEGVRVDNGFREGMTITSAFDPMLAKLIVYAQDRPKAIERAIKALDHTIVLGVSTNIDYLKRLLSHSAYQAGLVNTGFIPQYANDLASPSLSDKQINLLLAAAALSNRDFSDPAFKLPEIHASIGNWRN